MKVIILIGIILLMTLKAESAEILFQVASIPEIPAEPEIYIAGDFNNWNPGDMDYILQQHGDIYFIKLELPLYREIEYKFTCGSWLTVEKGKDFEEISNRKLSVNAESLTVQHEILNWRQADLEKLTGKSTITGRVEYLKDFLIPQLNRKRTIRVYLPPDYSTTKLRFPVIYMHDGQNLFDASTSFAGEWEIDETMERLHLEKQFSGAIVVGIDNDPQKRLTEYSPWVNAELGGGEGEAYIDFIVNTLKPYIDENYRTMESASQTMIAGSSMGGLISLYAGIKYPSVFGKIGVFSPAFWFAFEKMRSWLDEQSLPEKSRIYLDVGTEEGSDSKKKEYLEDAKQVYNYLRRRGFPERDIKFVIDKGAGHNETYWAKRFPSALLWLFSKEKK